MLLNEQMVQEAGEVEWDVAREVREQLQLGELRQNALAVLAQKLSEELAQARAQAREAAEASLKERKDLWEEHRRAIVALERRLLQVRARSYLLLVTRPCPATCTERLGVCIYQRCMANRLGVRMCQARDQAVTCMPPAGAGGGSSRVTLGHFARVAGFEAGWEGGGREGAHQLQRL